MRKLLFIIAVLLSFGAQSQTFTPIHNYQAPDGLDVVKFFGIPYGANPTLNGVNRPNAHPLYYKTTDSSLYLYSGNQWIRVGGGNGNKDTVKVGYGLNVIWDSTGQQLLYADHEDGLVNGGIVTKGIADWDLDVTDVSFYKNHKPYISNSTTVTIDTADATYDRIDVIGVDTTGNVFVITGTPSATPITPQVNPSSQLLLTTITVKAGSTFAPVITKIIYNEGTEWDTATSGTISAFFNNEDNPYNGSKDIFVQTYENGGALEFTDSEPDTATSNMVLKYFLYLNDEFTNSFQVQFFNDSDPVSNSLSFNSGYGLNPNNVNVYQNISIPLTSFVFSSNIFNKLKITMAGEDVSGAAGYYLDYIQLQKGLSQTGSGSCPLCIVDIHVTADSMYQVSIRQNGDTASVINWTGGGGSGGGGGISKLGEPTFGLTRPNDSTYVADTTIHSTSTNTGFLSNVDWSHFNGKIDSVSSLNDSTQRFYTNGAYVDFVFRGTDTSHLSDRINLKLNISDTVTMLNPYKFKVDTIYRSAGKDSIIFSINGIRRAILDSTGGGSSYTPTDTAFKELVALNLLSTTPQNKGLKLANYTTSASPQNTPPLVFRGGQNGNPFFWKIYGNGGSSNGLLKFDYSLAADSTFSTVYTFDRVGSLTAAGTAYFGGFSGGQFAGTKASLYSNSGFLTLGANAQPNPLAQIDLRDSTRGLLLNRVSNTQKKIITTNVYSGTISGGSGYTNGSYITKIITGGSGTDLLANITVSGGSVTTVNSFIKGHGYRVGDVLSWTPTVGGGSGFTYTVTKLTGDTAAGVIMYDSTINAQNTWNGKSWQGDFISTSASTVECYYGTDYSFTGSTSAFTLPAVQSNYLGRGNQITIMNLGSGSITVNSSAGGNDIMPNTSVTAASTITIVSGASATLFPVGTYFKVLYNN